MIEVTAVLPARYAEVHHGTVSALGLGLTIVPTPTPPLMLCILLHIDPPRLAAGTIHAEVRLEDADGNAVIGMTQVLDATDNPPVPAGGPMVPVWLVIPVSPLDLATGRYQWRVTVDDDSRATQFTAVPAG